MIIICKDRNECFKKLNEINIVNTNNVSVNVVSGLTLYVLKQLLRNTQIIIGTVPRIYDLIDRGLIKTFNINTYVIYDKNIIEQIDSHKYLLDLILPNNIEIINQ